MNEAMLKNGIDPFHARTVGLDPSIMGVGPIYASRVGKSRWSARS